MRVVGRETSPNKRVVGRETSPNKTSGDLTRLTADR